MRTLLLAIFILLAMAHPAAAEEYAFQESPGYASYKVANNFFKAIVRHPFHVVKLEGRNLHGTLLLTPGALEKGLKYSIELKVSEMDEPSGALAGAVASQLGASQITISGNSITIVRTAKDRDGLIIAAIRPRIEIGQRFSYPEIGVHAAMDGRIMRWEMHSQFSLTDFAIPIPTKWGIPAEDKVTFEGEVNFAPKE